MFAARAGEGGRGGGGEEGGGGAVERGGVREPHDVCDERGQGGGVREGGEWWGCESCASSIPASPLSLGWSLPLSLG